MNKNIIVVAIVTLAIGLGGGYWLAGQNKSKDLIAADSTSGERKVLFYRNPMNPDVTSPVPAKDSMGMDYIPVYAEKKKPQAKEILFYRNAMNPAVTSPVPAKDSMGMDYIPVYAEGNSDTSEPAGTVKIDPVTVQNIGVRTARAEKRVLSHQIHAVGRVDYDEERLSRLHPKTEGWIEKLYIDKTGDFVTKDTILLGIYSPQLVSSQQEYLLALNNHKHLERSSFKDIREGANELLRSSRERLELLDVPEHQIRELEKTRKLKKTLHIHSPFDGIVMKVGVREGQYVTPNTELYMLADLTNIWVYVDIYENELPWVKKGDTAQIKVKAIPGEVFTGKVTYIYPYMERKTRTNRIRLEFNNSDLRLKPEMFANVTLMASKQVDAIVVPSEAIVRSGTDNQLFVVREPGKFEPRTVTLGVSSEGMTQILSGVKPGEEVVTSSQFLIDSESKLREATQKMMDTLESESRKSAADKADNTDNTE
ncbi:Probable Co/Zn/Cd efflux system membrane fusion protein [hydrothermal vent metagenome]|uniref:Probable Co/Zn/Cd efflux system membrane fusion protein n=1 Tax=hydrothermal vent metagenome TaxID=652676 RepID=A0A3B0XZ30_9ZZZZ